MQDEEENDSVSKKAEPKKHVWLITYTADSVNITAEMLHARGIRCNECHTVAWRESKYCLVHLSKANRLRGRQLDRAIDALGPTHGIKKSLVVGYSALYSNDKTALTSVEEHPGFKHIVYTLNHAPDQLHSWMEEGDVRTNRKGFLWRFLEAVDPREKTHSQLVAQVAEWAPKIRQHAEQQQAIESLETMIGLRTREFERMHRRYKKLKRKYAALEAGRVEAVCEKH